MRVPDADAQLLGTFVDLVPLHDDGNVMFPDPPVYPPPGFLPAGGFDCGNDDITGYYWPIGLENGNPVFCEVRDAA